MGLHELLHLLGERLRRRWCLRLLLKRQSSKSLLLRLLRKVHRIELVVQVGLLKRRLLKSLHDDGWVMNRTKTKKSSRKVLILRV
jgi:hypothetical protein